MNTTQKSWLLVAVLILALGLVWMPQTNAIAERQVEAGFQRALTTFAAARTLNALLSTAQSVQLGAGASFQPGAVLEPLDDLVEQFSAIMLAATISFTAQRLLLELSATWPVCALLSAALLAWGVLRWRNQPMPRWLPRLALSLLCLRLAIPMLAFVSEEIYERVLARAYTSSQAQIQDKEVLGPDAQPDETLTERIKRWWAQTADIGKKIDAVKAKADGLAEHLIRLAAVFVIQTMVLPILFFWFLLLLYRYLAAGAPEKARPLAGPALHGAPSPS